jgi:hypothetical protein
MVKVWTGRIGEGGESEVNTTLISASSIIGKVLAPTKQLVFGHKHYRGDKRFSKFTPIDDATYRKQTISLIRARFVANKSHFHELLTRDETPLTCYCGKAKTYCHRFIIASHILPKCAVYFGIPFLNAGEC